MLYSVTSHCIECKLSDASEADKLQTVGWLSGAAWIVPLSTIFPGSPVITEEVCFKDIKKIVKVLITAISWEAS